MKLHKFFAFVVVIALLSGLMASSVRVKDVQAADLLAPPMDVHASKTPQMCFALDVVFLIDQSGSMSGATPNDPLGQRFNAPRYALDWLANNRLGMCKNAVHRIGVISFGTEAVVDLPMTNIEPVDQNHWNGIRPGLENQIQERNMNATNPLFAFIEAKKMLDSAPALGNEFRKRAIVLLTDGQPCVPGIGCSLDRNDPVNIRYMQQFVDQIRTDFGFSDRLRSTDEALKQVVLTYGSLADAPEQEINSIFAANKMTPGDLFESTYIYIIAMNSDEPYLETVGDTFRSIVGDYGGQLIDLEQNLNEVPRQFNQILSWLSGVTPVITGCGSLPVDPYLSGAMLDVFKSAQGLEVEIKYKGKSLKAGKGDTDFFGMTQYSEYGAVEHYRFNKPPAGLWDIYCAANDDDVKAAFIPFSATVMQVEPTDAVPQYDVPGASSDPNYPYYLKYKILDREKELTLDLDPEFPIEMKATITDPQGGITVIPMEFGGEGNWQSSQAIPVNLLGNYSVEVVGNAPCVSDPNRPNRCPTPMFEVFRDQEGQYHTASVDIFKLIILSPVEGETLPLHGKLISQKLAEQAVSLRLQLVDKNDQPIAYNDILVGDPREAFQSNLTAGEDTAPILLSPDPNDPSVFIGSTSEPFVKGDQEIQVEILPDKYDHEKYRPYNPTLSVSFTRADPLLQNPIFYRVLGWIFGLILLAIVIRVVICRLNPVRGGLTATNGGQSVSIPVYTGSCKSVLTPSRVPGLRTIGVQKMIVSNLPPQGKARRIKIVSYLSKGKREQPLSDAEYAPGSTININDWQVIYKNGQPAKVAPPRRVAPRPKARPR